MDSLFEEPSPEELRPPREEPPRRTTLEEVGNAVTHGVGALLSVAGMVLMLLKADTGPKLISGWIYGICLVLMFLMSCLYHAFRWGSRVKRVWRRFDYSSIYLLIGGTFTPMWLVYWGNRTGIILCIVQWAIILTGITLIGIFGPGKAKAVHMTLYIVLGWSALVFLPGMLRNDLPLFIYTLAGGVLYTLGIIPFARKSRGAHFIWHFFVLFGALTQWLGIYQYVF
ncbi:MAG: hemolysin III family protein [Clostridia bacterium]|nr:hemolysin III family protein [Clostridia bacterium]